MQFIDLFTLIHYQDNKKIMLKLSKISNQKPPLILIIVAMFLVKILFVDRNKAHIIYLFRSTSKNSNIYNNRQIS